MEILNNACEPHFPYRVSIRPIDGGTTDLDVNYEQVDTSEHIATAFWDMNSHQSKLLTAVPATSPSSTSLTPIEISFGECRIKMYHASYEILETSARKSA